MNILILGASGYTGACVKAVLAKELYTVVGTYRSARPAYDGDATMVRYDMEEADTLPELLRGAEPDVVIACLTGDFGLQMETYKRLTACLQSQKGKKLIFLSTANVFDGALDQAHFETDAPKAASDYGKFKIQCETLIRNSLGENGIILRLPEIWGHNCPRIQKIKGCIQAGLPVPTYQNIFVNYTTNLQVATWIAHIIRNDLRGIFHVGTADLCEYIDFHRKLIEALHLPQPTFAIKEQPERLVQAVLPGRDEIPAAMQLHVEDILRYLSAAGDQIE